MHIPLDISSEIRFRTARSSGKGGQHVNKVETMVTGLFDVAASSVLDEKQQAIVLVKLKTRINKDGVLAVRSQAARSQWENKEKVIEKMNVLVNKALTPEKPRKSTKPTRAAKEKRIKQKKQLSEKKQDRRWKEGGRNT